MKSFCLVGEAIFRPSRNHPETDTKDCWATDARGDSAMKKRQSFFTLVLSRWAIHLMAIAYAAARSSHGLEDFRAFAAWQGGRIPGCPVKRPHDPPMLACINGPRRPYAAMIKASVAICHSARFCSAFGSFHDVVGCLFERDELAAAGNEIGSSKRRLQPRVSCLFTKISSAAFTTLMVGLAARAKAVREGLGNWRNEGMVG